MKKTLQTVLCVLCVLSVLSVLPTEAQLPRAQKSPYNTDLLVRYLQEAAFPWTLTVCKGTPYGGDYADLSDALTAIPSRFPVRGPMQRVLVLVYPCQVPSPVTPHYEETTLTIPTWTTVQGITAGASSNIDFTAARILLRLTGTNTTCPGCPSALLKLETGTNLINFYIQSLTPPTGSIRVIEVTGETNFTNVAVQVNGTETHAIDMVYVNTTGVLVARDLSLTRNTFSSLSRGVVNAGTAVIIGGRFFVPSGIPAENIGTGLLRLYDLRIDPSSKVDLKRSSTGNIETFSTDYATESGGIIDRPIRTDLLTLDNTCRILTGIGTPDGTVTAPVCSIYLRQDGNITTTLYIKTSGTGNTGWTSK